MKENKEKVVTSGIEGEEDVQVQDNTTPLVVQKIVVQTGKRKSISNFVNLGDLPSHRGSKKQKSGKTLLPKVPKFTPLMVNLDDPAMNLVLLQTIPSVHPKNLPPIAKALHRTHPSEQTKHPPNLVLDEGYAWRTFKRLITDNEVNSCYNMSVRDYKYSTIHDLFMVRSFHYLCFIF